MIELATFIITVATTYGVLSLAIPSGRRIGGFTWYRVGRYSIGVCKRRSEAQAAVARRLAA